MPLNFIASQGRISRQGKMSTIFLVRAVFIEQNLAVRGGKRNTYSTENTTGAQEKGWNYSTMGSMQLSCV